MVLLRTCCGGADVARDKEEPHKYEHVLREEPFSFEVTRTSDPPGSAPIWNTTGHRLLFKEQYLEITSWVPATSTLYGLGERISSAGCCACPSPAAFACRSSAPTGLPV